MKHRISVTMDMAAAASGAADDAREVERHDRAVEKYREERRVAEGVADVPWWIDVGGEGEPC